MRKELGSVLIVDDELSVRDSLSSWFRKDGYRVRTAANATDALHAIQESAWDVALLDIKMPGMDGIELQEHIHKSAPGTVVIMITAFASVDTAVRALKQGAFDYVTKPVDPDELSHLVRRALEQKRLESENAQLRETIDELRSASTIVGESPEMNRLLGLIQQVAETDATVLIRGESGTGKELVALAIHANSRRRYLPMVPVNCGALPETLLESELFGHEKGAFTGAQYRRKGKIELADGGTLFLDEIGTISPKTQVDLLRVLETHEVTRVGGSQQIHVDFRVVCATNENLEELVAQGRFRQDLYYRINVFTLTVPPLRSRRSDIPLLARHFLRKLSLQMDKHITDFEPAAVERLMAHDWPGNVRELANAVERAMVVGRPPLIRADDLPFVQAAAVRPPAGDSLASMEQAHIKAVLDREGWNISKAAELLDIDRTTLYAKIKRYDLRREGA
ncbi:MAG: sigma-54-dependent Fis family transcriptional regulator [Myxococcales bacterium]